MSATLPPGAATRGRGRPVSPAGPLLRAQADALTREDRVNTLSLRPVSEKAGLDVAGSLKSARVSLSIEGASTLTLGVFDPERLLEPSGLLDRDRNGRLDSVLCAVDRLRWRLAHTSRDSDVMNLVFEDEVWALLRAHRGHLAVSRNAVTRAQFIERLVREIKLRDVPYFAPDKGRRQPRELPDYPDAEPSGTSTGFDKGAKLNVKSWSGSKTLSADEMRNAATMLQVAEQEEAGEKATMALIMAGIVEAPFFYNNPAGDASSVGVLQLLNIHMGGSTSIKGGRRDVAAVSRLFLTKGFYGRGGAIQLARDNPGKSAGWVAQQTQGSAFPSRYDQSRAGAETVIEAWSGDGPDGDAEASSHEAVRVKSYRFTRGLPGQPENSAQCAVRLAEEVNWRFFINGGVAYFVTDYFLLTRAADHIIEGYGDAGLRDWPSYEWDHRKLAANVTLTVSANAWSVRPGSICALRDMGSPLDGRWIVESFEFDLLDPSQGTVTLTKPIAPRKEPAPETFLVSVGDGTPKGEEEAGTPGSGGAKKAIQWARSRIGHYAEEHGNNRGDELDRLERGFGFVGAPWCAIFATTAVVMGGVTRDCRTAAVLQIRQWGREGSHGYQRGFRATPKPGDLVTWDWGGNRQHVGLIEKVSGSSVTFIQGNGGADKVDRQTAKIGYGEYVRPDYPD